MNLEIKHLAMYLPYQLQVRTEIGETNIVSGLYNGGVTCEYRGDYDFNKIKPLLRPMSDLDNPNAKGKSEEYYSFLSKINRTLPDTLQVDSDLDFELDANDSVHFFPSEKALYLYDFLFENHFDVFGLIGEGLAIDINKL